MGIIALLGFIFVVLPILWVVAGADTWQRNRHNWT
jgi:hypothetical protein